MSYKNMVTVQTFDEHINASICQGMLKANGIRSVIVDSVTGMVDGYSGLYSLQVHRKDECAARNLIKSDVPPDVPVELVAPVICPQCGSRIIEAESPSLGRIAIAAFFLFLPLLTNSRFRCTVCSSRWNKTEKSGLKGLYIFIILGYIVLALWCYPKACWLLDEYYLSRDDAEEIPSPQQIKRLTDEFEGKGGGE